MLLNHQQLVSSAQVSDPENVVTRGVLAQWLTVILDQQANDTSLISLYEGFRALAHHTDGAWADVSDW